MDSIEEPLGAAELNHTVTSSLKSGEAEIGAEITEPPKAKHQKETVKDFCVLDAKKEQQIFTEKEEKTEKKK